MLKRSFKLLPAAAVLLALSACGGGGTPTPPLQTRTAPPSFTTTSPATTTTSAAALGDPCQVLTEQQIAKLNATNPKKDDTGSGLTCMYTLQDEDIRTIGITVKGKPMSEFSSRYGDTTDITISGEKAKMIKSATGGCLIALSTGPSSRVEVSAYAGGHAQACPLARKVAKMVADRPL